MNQLRAGVGAAAELPAADHEVAATEDAHGR